MSQDTPIAGFSERDRKNQLLVVFVLGMFALVGIVFLAGYLNENRARHQLLTVVAQSSGVILNGQTLSDPSVVLAALGRLTSVPAHHSSPTTPIQLSLTGAPSAVAITIARDSQNPNEFWVYRPGSNLHNDPLGQDAGRIVSSDLDSFLRSRGL